MTPAGPIITEYTTPTGLRMLHLHVAGARVGHFGIAVNVGSRDEAPEDFGLAHFVEHTIFKGTARHRSSYIRNRMEAVGGELNAYTSKEETVVYSTFPAGETQRAINLIAELASQSVFPADELEKERDVVADEIDSYLDTPSEAVFDDFDDLLFANHGLGHNILGTRERLATFTSERCRRYVREWYTAPNIIAFYAGADLPQKVFMVAQEAFAELPATPAPHCRVAPEPLVEFDISRPLPIHQAHTVQGCRTCPIGSEERHVWSLLANIIGGPGMNSLLNVSLREKRGLVYSVEASTAFYTDTGSLTIYYGCDPEDTLRCRRLIASTLQTVASGWATPTHLARAVVQYLGQRLIAIDNAENHILAMARHWLLTGTPPSESFPVDQAIRAVTPEALARAASTALSTLTLTAI